jgi:hypothetical protein
MTALSRWFKSKPDAPGRGVEGDWEAQAAELEAEAEGAAFGFKGTPLNKAGDLARRAGDADRALYYYGRAIDAFLEAEQREAARGVANKIIRVHPRAVRTLCTLTWLDLAARHMATALLHLRDYVAAAKSVSQAALAGEQVIRMARISAEPEFLGAAADALDQLDLTEQARDVRAWAAAGGGAEAVSDARELAERCLQAAIRSNEGSK